MSQILTRPTRTPRAWFRPLLHDLRTQLPAAIRGIVQNGLVERAFQNALVPNFLYPQIADLQPIQGSVGDTITKTRTGLLTPITTGLGGNTDPSAATYSMEQFSLTLDQYANSMDTNILQSEIAAANKFLQDIATLGINAGQSLNRIARNRLYAAYGGGVTFVPTGGGTNTVWVVDDASGFDKVLVNGVPTAVSAGSPLNVTINGVANTVVGCVLATNTLTLGTTVAITTGWVIVSAAAPTFVRPNARTSQYTLTSTDVATFATFRSAVARLRAMAVPTVGGYYTAHIDATVEAELFGDADFKQALQGRVDSPIYEDLSIGRFAGIDWVRNIEGPQLSKTLAAGTLTVHRSIVVGAGALIAGPLADMGGLLMGPDGGADVIPNPGHIAMVDAGDSGAEVALIIRPPQDRLQQVVSSTWSWIGDFCVPSDSTDVINADAALYKRGVVVETI
jgi:N4-gp56 family major capsid protein